MNDDVVDDDDDGDASVFVDNMFLVFYSFLLRLHTYIFRYKHAIET